MANLFRKELEQHDLVEGVMFMQSMAGGTGSGVGSFLLEELRQDIGSKVSIFNTVVMPRSTGEVILQNYNSVFSLGTLYEYTDGIVFLENDKVSQLCQKLYNIKKPDLRDMNQVLAKQVNSFLFPMMGSASPKPSKALQEPGFSGDSFNKGL